MFASYRPEVLGAVERRFAEVNGQPGAVFFNAEARAVAVLVLDIAGGQIIVVRGMNNPDKLRNLDRRQPGT
jgi:RNA polymerase sigma-70 factor, ECF subfamily